MKDCVVGGVNLPQQLLIGAGVCKGPEKTEAWLTQAPVVSGSYTRLPRVGNSGEPRYYPTTYADFKKEGYGLNAFGMQNDGFEAAADTFRTWTTCTHPLIVSIAGFSIEDYLIGIEIFSSVAAVNAIELNLSCPNTEASQIWSFSPKLLERLFVAIAASQPTKPLWIKISPYSDPTQLRQTAELVNQFSGTIAAVVTMNTFPQAFLNKQVIGTTDGFAGLSGPVLKPIALGQVHQWYQALDPKIAIIGVGGVVSSDDQREFLDAGAHAIEVTSLAYWLNDPQLFWPTFNGK